MSEAEAIHLTEALAARDAKCDRRILEINHDGGTSLVDPNCLCYSYVAAMPTLVTPALIFDFILN
jgi:hypothetical protein